jgi:hypothetical protein
MRISPFIIIIAVSAVLAGCEKDLKPDPIAFNATTTNSDYQVGDTVDFSLSGNPDMITFYSGEAGANYDYRERTSAEGTPQMQFTSYAQYGTQTNTLALLVSSDFTGEYTEEGISKATWTDITSEATLSTGADNTPSGIIDLSRFNTGDKPVFVAFKYTGATGSTQRTWTIKNFGIDLSMQDGSVSSIANLVSAEWKAVNVKNPVKGWVISASQLQMAGGTADMEDNEDWLITTRLYLSKVSPDRGVPIKDISQRLDHFYYIYSKPGTYKAVFAAFNAIGDKQKSTLKEVDITVR